MRLIFKILLFICAFVLKTNAQIYFNNAYEIAGLVHSSTSVFEDITGNYFVLGQEITTTYRAINVIKTDSNGDTIWTKSFPRNQYAYYTGLSNSLIKTFDDNYVFAGTLVNLLDTFNTGDALLVKMDNNADTVWTKSYGGLGLDVANVAVESKDSGYVLIGSTNSYGSGQSDFYMVKTDSLGNFQWQKTFGTSAQEEAYSGIKTLDNGYMLSGYQGSQLYIVKTDINGNFQWQRTFSGTAGQGFINQFADSTYVLVGAKFVVGLGYQAFISKLTKTGGTIWQQTYGDVGDQQLYSIPLILNNGNIVVSGISTPGSIPYGLLIKTDSSGNQKWLRTYYKNPTIDNYLYDVKKTSDDGFIMTGGTYVATQDSWLIKVDSAGCEIANCNVGINEFEAQSSMFKVYPNPSSDYAKVEISLDDETVIAELIIYNILGSEILKQTVHNQDLLTINTKEFNNGIYLFVLKTNKGIIEKQKVIISK